MSHLAKSRTHTNALVQKLEDAGLVVGDGTRPTAPHGSQSTPGQSVFIPYCIVYPLSGGTFDGSLGCPDDDAELLWQVTCVGGTREQSEWVMDAVNAALVGQAFTVADRGIKRIGLDMAGGARRNDTVQPPTFLCEPRYRVTSVAST